MKRVLIISPNFPPNNTADMHRVRQMIPNIRGFGWDFHIVSVGIKYLESNILDPLLAVNFPQDLPITYVGALPIRFTRLLGVGSLSIRSFIHYFFAVVAILRVHKFDLIFFSTTSFHLLALGPIWKKLFGIPFVVDIQDPWRSDFYLSKPVNERPPKFRLNYIIDKYLEKYTLKRSDGIISVSSEYNSLFEDRYQLDMSRMIVEPFSGVIKDMEIAQKCIVSTRIELNLDKKNIVYIGRGGNDLEFAVMCFFSAIKLLPVEIFRNIHIWFIGTSYAPHGRGKKTIEPIAQKLEIKDVVTEITDRIPYYEALFLLSKADLLFVPGSTDSGYTASKIYPYILAEKPLITIFHQSSSVNTILETCDYGKRYTFKDPMVDPEMLEKLRDDISDIVTSPTNVKIDKNKFSRYSDVEMTKRIIDFFNLRIN